MTVRTSSLFAVLSSAFAIVACSGGGGGGGAPTPVVSPSSGGTATPTAAAHVTPSPVPTAAPTASPSPIPTYVLPSAAQASLSVYSIDSSPHGLALMIDGSASGVTPATAAPAYAKTPHTIAIVPAVSGTASPNPFLVTLTQTANGAHTIFYNQTIDTAGKIASISASTTSRRAHPFVRAFGVRRPAATFAHRPRYDDARIVVHYDPSRFSANRSLASVERAHGAVAAATYAQSGRDVTRIVTLARGAGADAALRSFAAEDGVTAVDRVRLRYPLGATSTGPVYPDDPYYVSGVQWYLDAIDASDAWGYGLGNSGVAIAIIDTGYDPQQPEVASGVTFSERIVGGTIDSGPGAATDTDGHGTFVSGIASAQTNNGAGFAGVSYGSPLQEYKVYPDGSTAAADSSDVAEAIRQAVANGAKVILAALGGEADAGPDPLERDAVAYALANGVTVVAGSGDEGNDTLDYPAAYDGVISVGASAVNDTSTPGSYIGSGNYEYVPAYSNVSSALGLVAPGGDPSSASDTDGIHWIANSYTTQPFAGGPACAAGTVPAACALLSSGTSPTAAQVAGTAALLLSQENGNLGPPQIAALLYQTADNISDPGQGHGRLDAHAALVALVGDPSPMPAVPLPSYQHFVAFAYANSGGTTPQILDVTYPNGVPVASAGTFRIADIPVSAVGTYKIAVWADTNGDGVIDAGDSFGVVSAVCASSGACKGANAIAVSGVAAGFVLP